MTAIDNPSTSESPSRLPAARPRRRWLSIVLGLVIFASGAVVGGGATVLVAVRQVREMITHPERAPDRIVARLHSKLKLNQEQTKKVEQIVKRRQAALMEIRREVQPQVIEQLDLFEQEVADVLQPDQKQRWHALLANLRTQWVPPMPPER
jgi:hypothetical protein